MVIGGKDVMKEPLERRQQILEENILPKLGEPIRYIDELEASLPDLIESVKASGLEGLVAKRRDSVYEPGLRSGAWQKDARQSRAGIRRRRLHPWREDFRCARIWLLRRRQTDYVARTHNGFTPSSRLELAKRFKGLQTAVCPFSNLPELKAGRWEVGLTLAKMQDCRWLKPKLVGQFEFVEFTPDNHLRHSRFMGLRDDKKAEHVVRER